jgi:ABC-type branched-subunit amino acid transport system substrate-binding protein
MAMSGLPPLLADGAEVLFGFVGTASSLAGEEVAEKEGAIFFAPFAASDTLRDAQHTNVFHVRPSLAAVQRALADEKLPPLAW